MRNISRYSNDVCPITWDKMHVPAEISTGHVFEKAAILKHIEIQIAQGIEPKCPMTRIPLKPFVQAPQNQRLIDARAYIKPQAQVTEANIRLYHLVEEQNRSRSSLYQNQIASSQSARLSQPIHPTRWQQIRPSLATLQQYTTILVQLTGAIIGARLGYQITATGLGKEALRLGLSVGSFLKDLNKLRNGQISNQRSASFYALSVREQDRKIRILGIVGGALIGALVGCGIERQLNTRLAQAYGMPLQTPQARRNHFPAHMPGRFSRQSHQNR